VGRELDVVLVRDARQELRRLRRSCVGEGESQGGERRDEREAKHGASRVADQNGRLAGSYRI
jgi:hypothetical protein